LHLVPHTLRANFRETYDLEMKGELCPYCRIRLEISLDHTLEIDT